MLIVLLSTTGRLPCLVELQKLLEQLFGRLYAYPFIFVCQYMRYSSGRNLSYFQNTFQNEMYPG